MCLQFSTQYQQIQMEVKIRFAAPEIEKTHHFSRELFFPFLVTQGGLFRLLVSSMASQRATLKHYVGNGPPTAMSKWSVTKWQIKSRWGGISQRQERSDGEKRKVRPQCVIVARLLVSPDTRNRFGSTTF
jgi:hypothetical protein